MHRQKAIAAWSCTAMLVWMVFGCSSCGDGNNCDAGQILSEGQCMDDLDQDGIPDLKDNCPLVNNTDQADQDHDGIGDVCDEPPPVDSDGDGLVDADDNCPQDPNPCQQDWDKDGLGDACTAQHGTIDLPLIIPVCGSEVDFEDSRDTTEAISDVIDAYTPNELDESGPEYVYVFNISVPTNFSAWIDFPEPESVDIDLHLLDSIDPIGLIERDHHTISRTIQPGVYWLVLDTYVSNGHELAGPYALHVQMAQSHAGTADDPIVIGDGQAVPRHYVYTDVRDTTEATSDQFDSYPPDDTNESGPEYVYTLTLGGLSRLSAEIVAPEPDGVDIDVQLLSSLDPAQLVIRDDKKIYAELEPGTYYLILDTYAAGTNPALGQYTLDVTVRPLDAADDELFNSYVLQAVDFLHHRYGLLGYDSAALTHDIDYGSYGPINATAPPKTMCVAASLEVILTAMDLYEQDTGDSSVWDFLPKRSYERLGAGDFRGHVWVNPDLNAGGTADATRHFGMGMTVPFEQLRPGAFINLNRTNKTGHSVVFLAFIDIQGQEYDQWNEQVVGFKYFSSQGGYDAGSGGLDYRYAVFDEFGEPEMPYKRDVHIIYSTNQRYLNTGMMYTPDLWLAGSWVLGLRMYSSDEDISHFDSEYFNGVTIDDRL